MRCTSRLWRGSLNQPDRRRCGASCRLTSLPACTKGNEGTNRAAPVGEIHVRADALALFVATMGQETCRLIAEGFARNDFAVASMLDAVASAAADRAASVLAERFLDRVRHAGRSVSDAVVLPYSPGYCGWHITGQRKLFAFLDSRDGAGPGSIGVTLRESCLMEPLKSVSGVLIVGPRDMHGFPDDYPFCSTCDTHACRDRIAAL